MLLVEKDKSQLAVIKNRLEAHITKPEEEVKKPVAMQFVEGLRDVFSVEFRKAQELKRTRRSTRRDLAGDLETAEGQRSASVAATSAGSQPMVRCR